MMDKKGHITIRFDELVCRYKIAFPDGTDKYL